MPNEFTPLLVDTQGRRPWGPIITREALFQEAQQMIPLAWPVSIGYLLQMSLNMAAVMALGRIGTNALASMALATLYANVTGYSIIVGMSAAIDTLCSQAYGEYLAATGEKKEIGRHFSRAVFINYVICIPVAILWAFTEPLLELVGQDKEIAVLSGKYTLLLIPSLIPYVIAECTKRFLMSQGIMTAQMIVIGVVAPINAFLQYVFVFTSWKIGEEGEGAPFALMLSNCLIAIALVLYARYVNGGDAFIGVEWDQIFNGRKLWIVAKLGVAGVLMTCSEWWAWEIVALASGLLGPQYLAAQTIILSACGWAYTLPLGFSFASSTRIGNSLGFGNPHAAKLSAYVAGLCGFFLTLLNSSLFIIGRNSLGYIFTNDEAVNEIVRRIIPLAAAFQLADVFGCVCGGILRGAGRPEIGAYLNLVGYYVLGIPLGIFLCFNLGWKMLGLWSGLSIALFMVSFIEIYMIYKLDWVQEAENARQRSMDLLNTPVLHAHHLE